MIFGLLDGQPDFLRPLEVTLWIFSLSYLGSLIVDRERRFKAFYSISLTLYILLLIGRHRPLR